MISNRLIIFFIFPPKYFEGQPDIKKAHSKNRISLAITNRHFPPKLIKIQGRFPGFGSSDYHPSQN